MKHFVFFIICFWVNVLLSQGQTQSMKINVTPTAYIKSKVEQRMEKWLQKGENESLKEYEIRVSEENKRNMRKRFETVAIAEYKILFINNTNWREMRIASYDNDKQAFLILATEYDNFMMPVLRTEAREFEAEFQKLKKTDPDFYFEGDIVKLSRLTFINSKGKAYTYNAKRDDHVITDPVTTNNRLVTIPELASIIWLQPLSSREDAYNKDFKIQACIKSKSQITGVSVLVNKQTAKQNIRGISAVADDGCDFTVNRTIILAHGTNELAIIAENLDGKSVSELRYVNYEMIAPAHQHHANRRLALVMGNSAYSFSPLANPVNDVTDIAAKLKTLGFDVMLLTDKTKGQMERAIDKFGEDAKDYDVAMFFYAGHAIQRNGKNYLIPVNFSQSDIGSERMVEYDCTPMDRVLANMEYSKCKLKLVVLDACRDNPFERTRSITRKNGLSLMNAPIGTFIAYSTSPDAVAFDGIGRNSPYTTEFLKKLDVKGLKIEDVFKQVREGVLIITSGQQVPWDQSSIVGDFYFNY